MHAVVKTHTSNVTRTELVDEFC